MKTCQSCKSTNIQIIPYININVPEDVIHWADYSICCCNDCGLGTISPEIPRKDLIRFYKKSKGQEDPDAYSSHIFTKNFNPGYVSQALLVSLIGNFYNHLDMHILDIGCGTFGYSFNAFHAIFKNKKTKFYGIDASPIVPKILEKNGINYLGEDYSVLYKHHQTFDIITMSHYLEHLMFDDAYNCLSIIKSALNPGGVIMIEVPRDDLRVPERQIIPSAPPHVTFFTLPALKKIIERAGFTINYAYTVGPDMQVLRDEYYHRVNHGNVLQQAMRRIKKLIPIYAKERIKNIMHTTTVKQLLPHLIIVNSGGSFLRIIAQVQTNH